MRKAKTARDELGLSLLDANIIALLQHNGRSKNTDIAERLGVTEGTIRNRIARMIEDGVMKFGVWADPIKIGYQTYAFIDIRVNPPELENVARQLADLPEIVFVGLCTGSFDIHAAALFSSNEHMYELITKGLNHIPGVVQTSTSTVMRILKREFEYPVPGATVREDGETKSRRTRKQRPAEDTMKGRPNGGAAIQAKAES